jgi:hypothetical protein
LLFLFKFNLLNLTPENAATNLPSGKSNDGHFDAIGQSNASVGSLVFLQFKLANDVSVGSAKFRNFCCLVGIDCLKIAISLLKLELLIN